MRFSWKYSALLGGILAVGACADREAGPLVPVSAEPSAARSATADRLARALAGAMQRPEVRESVRDALRASPYGEHKVALRDFAATEAGRVLVSAAAQAAQTDVATVDAWIAALPAMDFYAPFREHRLSWRASGDVVVAATLDENASQITGFGTEGDVVRMRLADGVPERPMLLLQPAEGLSRRVNPQPSARGAVIQDATDGELSGRMILTDQFGNTRTVDLAPLAPNTAAHNVVIPIACPDGEMDTGDNCIYPIEPIEPVEPLPPTTSPATILARFSIRFNTEWGDEDVRFTGKFFQDGVVVATGTVEVDANCCDTYNINRVLFPYHRITDSYRQRIEISVVEMDPTWDDNKGRAGTGYDDGGYFFTWPDGDKGANLQPYLYKSCQVNGAWVTNCKDHLSSVDLRWDP